MPDSTLFERQGPALKLVVSGDVTLDWHLARASTGEKQRADMHASWQRGGAALLADLIETIAARMPAGTPRVSLRAVAAPHEPTNPGDDALNHSYAIWTQFAAKADDTRSEKAWRSESFLGVESARTLNAVREEWERLARELPDAHVIVLDDAGLGFRDLSQAEVWRCVFGDPRPWVVLKQARPVAQGHLWEHLLRYGHDRLITILTIDDLRGREVQVSRELSWERTAQDLLWELVHKPKVSGLSRVAHAVVSFGPAGAALVSAPPSDSAVASCTLFFDPKHVESTWEAEHPGAVMGGTDTLTAALVREVILNPDVPDLGRGIQSGIAASRRLHLDGYEARTPGRAELQFPISRVVEEMQSGRSPLEQTKVSDPAVSDHYWTILEDRCTGDLGAKAAEVTLDGPAQALEGVPLGRFGKLVTADRSEIEAFRSVGGLIAEYVTHPQQKPLSIGVFGPPGAGKSFGVKEVARSVGQGHVDKEPLEFNVAQLSGPADLADAFHLVRDKALNGKVPLVFWDEFDTSLDGEPLGWLRYFLAPMQDGKFRQGQLTHPIGRSIFVFAGGTSARVEDFSESVHNEAGRLAKGPDFVSRLKGFVNVLGPNPQGTDDPYYVIRRAILLRSILQRNTDDLFGAGRLRIDPGVLRAFLQTKEYRHGARSLEAIIAMSRLAGKSTYERSSLPAEPQLNLHVDAEDFLALVQRPDLEGELLKKLARANHEVYREELQGRTHLTAEERKSLKEYDDLADYKKIENLRYVRDIPDKLALVGCVMVPGRADLALAKFTEDEVETLARDEHERWLHALGPGWHFGKRTDKDQKAHVDYRSWAELPQKEKEKDRNLVRKIPLVLSRAGYAVVRLESALPGQRQPSKEPLSQ